MSKGNKDVKRGIVLYIDGKEVKRDLTDIKAEIRKLTKELDHMTIGSKEYNEQMTKIRHLNSIVRDHKGRLREVNDELGKSRLNVGKLVDGFNRFGGVIVSVIGFLTGFVLALRSIREERNKLEESQAGLKALTGLDDESISWLTDQAKTLSTTMTKEGLRVRQSAAEILDAFMLVGSAKPELLGDKEALKQVTEEAMRLQAAAKDITLNEAVDSLTLSLNQYGAAADQASRYVNALAAGSKEGSVNIASQAKAIQKAGTIAASSNIPIEELIGTIEMLGEKGVKDEVAGTGLKTFFTRLATGATNTNPKVVGLTNALDNLNEKVKAAEAKQVGGGTGLLKKLFGDEGMQTAMILTQNAEKVKEYTAAVTGTNVAYEQSAINSATAAAKLDQARNSMKIAAMELGEKLNPAFTISTNMMTNIVKYLPGVIDWFQKWGGTIMQLAGFVAIYTVYTKAGIIEEKLTVFWKEKIIATSKRLYATIAKHPYAALGLAIVALITYLRSMNKEMSESERISKTLSDISDKAAANISDEKSQLEQYLAIARDENKSKTEREAALKRINDLSPEYLGNLTLEKINTQNATTAVNKYVDSLLILEDIRQTQSKMSELRNQRDSLMKNGPDNSFLDNVEAGAANMLNQFKTSLGLYTDSWADNVLNVYANKGVEQLRSIDKELSVLDKRIVDSRQKLIDLDVKDGDGTTNTTGGNGTDDKGDTKDKNKFAKAEEAYYKKIADIKKQYLADDKMTQETYNQQIQDAEMQLLNDKLEVAGLEPKERQQIADQILNIEIKMKEKRLAMGLTETKEVLSASEKRFQLEFEKAAKNYKKHLISREDFLKKIKELQQKYGKNMPELPNVVTEEQKKELELYLKKLQEVIDKYNEMGDEPKKWNETVQQNWKEINKYTDASSEEMSAILASLIIDLSNLKVDGTESFESLEASGEAMFTLLGALSKQFGIAIGEMLAGEEEALGEFLKSTLNMVLTTIEQLMIAYIAQTTMRNIAEMGVWGLLKAAGEIALITAAFESVKGLVGNFYTGGYTSSGDWDQPQGIVHSNEFVANRYAVANPAIRPVLDLIDSAQRTGSIANLTSEDIAAVVPRSAAINSSVPSVTSSKSVQISDPILLATLNECSHATRLLVNRLNKPFITENYVTGRHGIEQALNLYNKLKSNVSRP